MARAVRLRVAAAGRSARAPAAREGSPAAAPAMAQALPIRLRELLQVRPGARRSRWPGGRGGRVGVGACGAAGCRARGAAGRRAEGPAASPGGVSLRPRGALTTVCFNETPPGRERPESLSAALLVRQRPGREPVPPGRGAGVAHIPRSGRTGEGGLLRPARGPHAPCARDVSASGQTISVP